MAVARLVRKEGEAALQAVVFPDGGENINTSRELSLSNLATSLDLPTLDVNNFTIACVLF